MPVLPRRVRIGRRRRIILTVALMGGFFLLSIVFSIVFTYNANPLVPWQGMYAWVIAFLVAVVHGTCVFREHRLKRRVESVLQTGGSVCENCLYILKTDRETGLCPECGEPYGPETLEMWRDFKPFPWGPLEFRNSNPSQPPGRTEESRK